MSSPLVVEAVEQAIAEEYVRLQGSTLQQLLDAAGIQQQGLSASIDVIAQEAYDSWQASGNQAAQFLYNTLRVSQDRTLESVLRQPDVQAALRRPFEHATDDTRDAITQAWQEGAAQGHGAANQDLGIAGLEPTGPCSIDQDALNRLLDDASANGDAAYARYRAAIQSLDPDAVREAIRNVTQDQALRARAGVDVAGKYAANDAKICAYDQAAQEQGITLYKVWVTSFSPATCRHCAALHGTRRRLSEPFPRNAAFGSGSRLPVWGDLGHPPRHPNCRCRIVLHQAAFEDEEGPTLASMIQMALQWWHELVQAIEHPLREIGLARVYVPRHPRFKAGHIEDVDPYWYQREGAVHRLPTAKPPEYDSHEGEKSLKRFGSGETEALRDTDYTLPASQPPPPPLIANGRMIAASPGLVAAYDEKYLLPLKVWAEDHGTTLDAVLDSMTENTQGVMADSRPAVRVPQDVLLNVLKVGVENQFQTNESHGLFDPSRRMGTESELFGYPIPHPSHSTQPAPSEVITAWEPGATNKDVEGHDIVLGQEGPGAPARWRHVHPEDDEVVGKMAAEDRPIYGYVGDTDGRDGWEVGQYGDVALVLKPEVAKRTTTTQTDSLDGQVIPEPMTQATWRQAMPTGSLSLASISGHDYLGVHSGPLDTPDWREASPFTASSGYIEAQIHGGVRPEDIEKVVFTADWTGGGRGLPPKSVTDRLDELGIKWQVVSPKLVQPEIDSDHIFPTAGEMLRPGQDE